MFPLTGFRVWRQSLAEHGEAGKLYQELTGCGERLYPVLLTPCQRYQTTGGEIRGQGKVRVINQSGKVALNMAPLLKQFHVHQRVEEFL
ncbi:hypothetical protein DPMN_043650 [Dreissena polymorpha]|uniref:Uncharacterized protein n=1 Tax=Dreissena polymorpha TaxID=45954 RepID=A0A9D4D366_DREPO|nr:hypothetical protein DPMN_043650 [Dreissena polymorpha]